MHYSERTIRSFVLRSGKLTQGQKNLYRDLSPKYCLPYQDFSSTKRTLAHNDAADPKKEFWAEQLRGRTQFLCELGFGTGSATWQLAKMKPQALYLGIEVYRSGISSLMREAEKQQLDNLRIVEHDALEVLQNMIPQQFLDGLHIFFPDPWPKKKHCKRRIVNQESLQLFYDCLKPGAYCYFVTDWQDYAESVRALAAQQDWSFDRESNFSESQTWRPQSKFEAKAIREGRPIFELFLVKKSLAENVSSASLA